MSGVTEVRENLPGSADILLGYQKTLLATVAANAVTVYEKSRRIGVTWAIASQAVLTSGAARDAGGMDTLYIGYNLDMAREFIDTCGAWVRAIDKAAGAVSEFLLRDGDRDIQAFRISFDSGFEIVALASRPRSLRGRQGFVIIDEAAFHDDLLEVMKAALALLIWGGKLLVISTHDGAANPFGELVDDIRKGRKPYALLRTTFDDALDDGLFERVCLKTKRIPTPEGKAAWIAEIRAFYGEGADEELDVIAKQGTGVFLSTSMIERRMEAGIPVIRWSQPNTFAEEPEAVREADTNDFLETEIRPLLAALTIPYRSYFGMDFGRSGDLSVIWLIQLLTNMQRRPPFIVELRNIPFEQQRQILFYILARLPRFMGGIMDATGNGSYLAEVAAQRFGFSRIKQLKLSESWYREFSPKLKAAFEDGTTVLPQDAEILGDHRAIKIVRGVPQVIREGKRAGKGEDKASGGQRHGDSAIAHMLAYAATLLDIPDLDAIEISGAEAASLRALKDGPVGREPDDVLFPGGDAEDSDWGGYLE